MMTKRLFFFSAFTEPEITKVTRVIETEPSITTVTRVVSGKYFLPLMSLSFFSFYFHIIIPFKNSQLLAFPGPRYSVSTSSGNVDLDGE